VSGTTPCATSRSSLVELARRGTGVEAFRFWQGSSRLRESIEGASKKRSIPFIGYGSPRKLVVIQSKLPDSVASLTRAGPPESESMALGARAVRMSIVSGDEFESMLLSSPTPSSQFSNAAEESETPTGRERPLVLGAHQSTRLRESREKA
jgi:hypothetical protein